MVVLFLILLLIHFFFQGKKDGKAIGEIWVKSVKTPQAFEPLHERWINVNRLMIEEGLAFKENL